VFEHLLCLQIWLHVFEFTNHVYMRIKSTNHVLMIIKFMNQSD